MYDIAVTTCDKYLWALQPFAYLWNRYWPDSPRVHVFGHNKPAFALPDNFEFHALDLHGEEYPASLWTNMVKVMLDTLQDRHVLWMLEDYWLCGEVKREVIERVYYSMLDDPYVLKFDLTNDRQLKGHKARIWEGDCDNFRVFETHVNTEYQLSLQAAIWNKERLYQVMEMEWSPWEFEIQGSLKLRTLPRNYEFAVLGTDMRPMQYVIALRANQRRAVKGGHLLPQPDVHHITTQGWIPNGWIWQS